MPRVITASPAFSISNELRDELIAYHEEHKQETLFMEPARTKVTALEFDHRKYLKDPTPPTETELRQYFTLYPGEFARPVKKSPSPESNSTKPAVNPTEEGERGPPGVRSSVRKSRVTKKKPEEKPLPAVPTKKEEQPVKPDAVQPPVPVPTKPVPAEPVPAKPVLPEPAKPAETPLISIPPADGNATAT